VLVVGWRVELATKAIPKGRLRLSQRDYRDRDKKKPRTDGPERRQLVVDRLAGKLTKEDANYRDLESNAPRSKEVCFECEHYLSPGSSTSACRRVAGLVEAGATCDIFVARAKEGVGRR
jgi:hypothetical protein